MAKKPSCIKADKAVSNFLLTLDSERYLREIVDNALDVLKGNMFAGQIIEKKKFPKIYIRKFGVTNLYKYNLDASHRLVYTLVANGSGIALIVLEILDHKNYEKRFGYH